MEQHQEPAIPAVDQIANGDHLQMYKAVIPYLPKTIQKNCMMFIKVMEINNLLSFYNSPMTACSVPEEPVNTEKILAELRQYADDAQNQQIDHLLNLVSALRLYQTYQEI